MRHYCFKNFSLRSLASSGMVGFLPFHCPNGKKGKRLLQTYFLYFQYINWTTNKELHTFTDAAEDFYATGKSKDSQLNPKSIPNLELQAGVGGVRLASTYSTYKFPKKFQLLVMYSVAP